ncbi:MAG TPA: hypothetical protein VF668_17000, partial [Pyrinomonadaceae bacterium]
MSSPAGRAPVFSRAAAGGPSASFERARAVERAPAVRRAAVTAVVATVAVALVAFSIPFRLRPARAASQVAPPRRVTHTPAGAISLNPTLGGDGRALAFESSADLAGTGSGAGFRLLTADALAPASFSELAFGRAPAPAVSQDGSVVVFAGREDPLGENRDGDSEIFIHEGGRLRQLTRTTPDDPARRAEQGCFRPSVSDDGRLVAFACDRDLAGRNADLNSEIFLLDTRAQTLLQITSTEGGPGARDAKVSGDGSRVACVRERLTAEGVVADVLVYAVAGGATFEAATGVRELSLTYGRALSDDGLRLVYSARGATNATQVFMLDGRNGYAARQLTRLGSRQADVPLHPTISGDGSRVAFATRRNVAGGNPDASVELYLHDLPTDTTTRLTDAPAAATAEVVSSLDDRGALVAFSFPRALTEPGAPAQTADDPEIYLADAPARPGFAGGLQIFNAAAPDKPPAAGALAPGSLAVVKGENLALAAAQA